MTIPGLPEGIECVRIGIAEPDEFEIVGTEITKGPRGGSVSQIIVQPQKGYQFRYNIRTMAFDVIKVLDAPETIESSVKFVVTSANDRDLVKEALARLKLLPGYVDPSNEVPSNVTP